MAVLCREETLEETMVKVCAEFLTSCPTLNAAQVAACGTALAALVGTLLEPPPPVVTGRHPDLPRRRETGRRILLEPAPPVDVVTDRHPDLPLRKTARRTTAPAYASLRAVHVPAVTPVVGRRSTAASLFTRETRARLIAEAMLNERASYEFTRTLQETRRIGHDREHTQVALGLLAAAVGLLLLGKVVHKVVGRIGGDSGATMATLEENRAALERIFRM